MIGNRSYVTSYCCGSPKTFDLTQYCNMCGIGARQVAPFRLKQAPKLQNSVLQLNWVFDELFVARSVWREVFEPLGIGFRPVVLHRTGEELGDLVQLDINRAVDVDVDCLKRFKDCRRCGRRKYWPKYLIGPYPPPLKRDAGIFRSHQYFGDGLQAFNSIYISQRLFRDIRRIGLRGSISTQSTRTHNLFPTCVEKHATSIDEAGCLVLPA